MKKAVLVLLLLMTTVVYGENEIFEEREWVDSFTETKDSIIECFFPGDNNPDFRRFCLTHHYKTEIPSGKSVERVLEVGMVSIGPPPSDVYVQQVLVKSGTSRLRELRIREQENDDSLIVFKTTVILTLDSTDWVYFLNSPVNTRMRLVYKKDGVTKREDFTVPQSFLEKIAAFK